MITDRYVDSTLAYQGAGRDLLPLEVERLARWATADLRPHLTVLLDVEPELGLGRFETADRIEAESIGFHQRVRDSFLDAGAGRPGALPRRRRPARRETRSPPSCATGSRRSSRSPTAPRIDEPVEQGVDA